MNGALTFATAGRVLRQLSHDPRSIVLMLVAPSLLVGPVRVAVQRSGGRVRPVRRRRSSALFPFIVMFLITSITTLRERRSGTLERLMTTPLGKADFILGYALAFGLMATLQAIDHRDVRGVGVRARGRGRGLAARTRRGRRRDPRHRARAARERVRAHRVPGGAVHAADRVPADPARRALHAARGHARGALRRSRTSCR